MLTLLHAVLSKKQCANCGVTAPTAVGNLLHYNLLTLCANTCMECITSAIAVVSQLTIVVGFGILMF